MNEFLDEKIKEIALEYKLTQSQVKEIFYSQFKYLIDIMKEDSEKPVNEKRQIKLRGFGTFAFNEKRFNKVQRDIKRRKDARKNLAQTSPEDGEGARIN